jgi:hypothetical protein
MTECAACQESGVQHTRSLVADDVFKRLRAFGYGMRSPLARTRAEELFQQLSAHRSRVRPIWQSMLRGTLVFVRNLRWLPRCKDVPLSRSSRRAICPHSPMDQSLRAGVAPTHLGHTRTHVAPLCQELLGTTIGCPGRKCILSMT